jgi:hypothetical protein
VTIAEHLESVKALLLTDSIVTYSYHWADPQGNLIRRWDNTPHFPGLPGFPHHIHDGATNTVYPGVPVNIFAVFSQVKQQFGSSPSGQT